MEDKITLKEAEEMFDKFLTVVSAKERLLKPTSDLCFSEFISQEHARINKNPIINISWTYSDETKRSITPRELGLKNTTWNNMSWEEQHCKIVSYLEGNFNLITDISFKEQIMK